MEGERGQHVETQKNENSEDKWKWVTLRGMVGRLAEKTIPVKTEGGHQ